MAALAIGMLLLSALVVTLMALYGRHRNEQMLHQERMAGLEKGVLVPAPLSPAPWSPRVYLLRGLIWSLAGAALAICLFGISLTFSHGRYNSVGTLIQARDIARSFEIPLDQAQAMVEKDEARSSGAPVALALLGLIPLGVGLAYLVFYYTDPSRKAGAGPS
jgi:hypothetical protein